MSTILAVDDSTTMRKCLEITFAGTEFTLVAVDNAQDALEKVKTMRPALVIADVSLPTDGIADGGYELVSTLKLAQPDLPVLMLSSRQHPFDPTKGAQANGHIDKPFDTQALQDRVREMVRPAERIEEMPMQMQPNVAASTMKQVAVPERAPPSSKIPAPRRKRPTPAMVPTPQPAPPTQPGPTPKPVQPLVTPSVAQAAAMRRTVPFAMPSNVKRPGSTGPTTADFGRRQPADRTMPMLGPQALAGLQGRAVTQPGPQGAGPSAQARAEMQRTSPSVGVDALRKTQPQVPQPPPRPAGDTLPGVQILAEEPAAPATPAVADADGAHKRITERGMQAVEGAVAAVPAATAGDLRTRLASLGLTKEQVEGVLALSREIIEAAVWEVVPTLAETLIKEEIRRLTKD